MKNKEIKNLLLKNLLSIIILISISIFNTYKINESYNKQLLDNEANIIGNIINNHPELEDEIVKDIINKDNYDLGYNLLKKYDLPTNNKIIYSNVIILLVGLIIILVINYIFIKNNYKKINKIDEYLNDVLSGNYKLDIKDYSEGDISNLKNDIYKVTVILKEQSDLLQKEKKYLEELLEDISHQIKTPLTSMYMIQDILTNEKNEKIKKEFLIKNKSQIERIEWLITSLLKISRLDSGTIKLKKEKIKTSSLITKSIEPLKILMELKNIKLDLNIKNIDVNVDINWMSEALLNIIKNATEYTKDEISIIVTNNPIYTEFRISDNGIGINSTDLPHIFERFYKGNHNKDSIGIGLNMSKKIIELQGGTVEVETKENVGTTFIVKLYKNVI